MIFKKKKVDFDCKGNKETRNSNFEIYRIICMILIVAHHYSVHGFFGLDFEYSLNKYIVDILSLGGKIGVNGFVLITGYYMINSKFTLKKLLKLAGEIWFYSITILLIFIFILTPYNTIEIKGIVCSFIPILTGKYWFATVFILLMLFSPFINEFLHTISKNVHLKLIVILILVECVFPTFSLLKLYFNEIIWFVTLYIISAYIKLYQPLSVINAKKHLKLAIFFIALLIASAVVLNLIAEITNIGFLSKHSTYFSKDNSPLVLGVSLELFLYFGSKKIYYNKLINIFGSATFGVYLIHDNMYMKPFLWNIVFKNKMFYSSDWLIIHSAMTIIVIYFVCTIIDILRIRTIEKWWLNLINNQENRIKRSSSILINKLNLYALTIWKKL